MTPCAIDSLVDELDVVRRDSFRCTILERDDSDDGNANGSSDNATDNNNNNNNINNNNSNSNNTNNNHNVNDHWFRNRGLVLDDACSESWLSTVQATRLSLPLNSKRPTVDRRFYRDPTRSVVCSPLESIVRAAVEECCSVATTATASASTSATGSATGSTTGSTTATATASASARVTLPSTIYCNRYLRFLEYNRAGTELLPHRDGIKTCEETGIRSTHTLLLFLSDCPSGGETLLMDERSSCDEREQKHEHERDQKNEPKQEQEQEQKNEPKQKQKHKQHQDQEHGTHWSRETNLELSQYEQNDGDGGSPNAASGAGQVSATNDGKSGDSTNRIPNPRRLRYTTVSDRESSSNCSSVSFFCLSDATLTAAGSCGGDEVETEGECKCKHECKHKCKHKCKHECKHECKRESPSPPPPPLPSRGIPPPRSVSVGIQPACGRILLFPHHWAHAGALCKSVPKIALRAELAMVANNTEIEAEIEIEIEAEIDDAE